MKNITQIADNFIRQYCSGCSTKGFFSSTPNGGDYITCPLCDNFDWESWNYNTDKYNEYYEKYGYMDNGELTVGCLDFGSYCDKCNILFETGCTHNAKGCTDSIYNGHIIGKWEYKGEIYIGMPCFDNVEEYFKEGPKIKVLEVLCPNNIKHCIKPDFSKEEYPQYYSTCPLKQHIS